MAEEKKVTEEGQVSEQVIPEAFGKALDAIEKENTEAPAGESETIKDESADLQVSDEETTEAAEETAEETPAGESELSAEDALRDIDADVLDACRKYGWDDEKIANVAKINPKLFDEVRELLEDERTVEETPAGEKPAETKAEFDELKFNLDPDIVGKDVADSFNKVAERINTREKRLSEQENRLQSERNMAFTARIDNHFDKFAKRLPELGKSSNLNNQQKRTRREIYTYAQASALMGMPIERAIENEIRLYPYRKQKVQDLKKQAKQEVLDELNKQERRMTNPPSRRRSEQVNRTFANEAEAAEYRMSRAEEKAGLTS